LRQRVCEAEGNEIDNSFLPPVREFSTMDIEPSFRIEKGHRITYYNCVVSFKPLICFFLRLMSRFVLGKGGERVKRGRFTYAVAKLAGGL
jgi:hypothetical protein